jgi:putative SOS response-associated peptidase YedK
MKDGQPYAGRTMGEMARSQTNTDRLTFTAITTDPNEVVEPLHDRMVVIIPEKDYDRWLKHDPDRPPIDLLRNVEQLERNSPEWDAEWIKLHELLNRWREDTQNRELIAETGLRLERVGIILDGSKHPES